MQTNFTIVLAKATEVLGSEPEALRWLEYPKKALGHKTPLDLIETPDGAQQVMELLLRIEHGVFS